MRRRIEAERRSRPRSASGIGSAEPVATGPCGLDRRALGVPVAPVRGHREPVPLNDASRSALGWTGLGAVWVREKCAGI